MQRKLREVQQQKEVILKKQQNEIDLLRSKSVLASKMLKEFSDKLISFEQNGESDRNRIDRYMNHRKKLTHALGLLKVPQETLNKHDSLKQRVDMFKSVNESLEHYEKSLL